MMKLVSVLVGAGSIGQAIIRRVSAGKHIVLADYSIENANRTKETLENAGYECSGHRLPALLQEQNNALAMTPVDELLELPFLKAIDDTLKAYQYSKRCNVLRVMYEATCWGRHGATINSISPGIIITPLANDELHGPRKDGYLKMIEGMPARRAGTPDDVGDLAEFLMSSRGRFISGADFLIDGGCTASYWYGDLQYLKATH